LQVDCFLERGCITLYIFLQILLRTLITEIFFKIWQKVFEYVILHKHMHSFLWSMISIDYIKVYFISVTNCNPYVSSNTSQNKIPEWATLWQPIGVKKRSYDNSITPWESQGTRVQNSVKFGSVVSKSRSSIQTYIHLYVGNIDK